MSNFQQRSMLELGKDMILYGVMSGLAQSVSFLLLPLFTRAFSPEQYGVIDVIATFMLLLSTLMRFSLPSALNRYFYDAETKLERQKLITTLFICIALFGTLLVILGLFISDSIAGLLLDSPDSGLFIVLAAVSAFLSALSSVPEMALRMERKILQYNALNIIYTAFYALLSIYFVFVQSFGLIGVFTASVTARAFQFLVALYWGHIYFTKHLSLSHLIKSLKYSVPLMPAVLVTWVNSQADRLMLLMLLGLSSVGVFGAAAKVAVIIQLLTMIFRQAWSPYAMSLLQAPSLERDQFYAKVLLYFSGSFACLGLALIIVSPEILAILVPLEFRDGYVVIPWLIGAAILHASSNITNIGILLSEKTYINSIAAWIGATVNILVSILLIKSFGLSGAAFGTFIAALIFTVVLWRFSEQHTSIRFPTKPISQILACYIITSIIFLWSMNYDNGLASSLVFRTLMLVGATAFITYQTVDRSLWLTIQHVLGQYRFAHK